MNQTIYRRIAAMAALVMFVGCQTGMKPSTMAKADASKPQAKALDNAKASTASTQQRTTPAKAAAKTADADAADPKARTAFYRADAKPAVMPHVLLSKGDEAACKVKVGDAMPT